MALCRFSSLCNSTTSLHPFPALACSTFSPSPFYLPKPVHFTNLISPFRRTPAPYPFSRASLCSSSSSTMESPPDGYRKNVGICLINDSKKIFLASRLDIPGAWQMPQGGVDENEDLRDAVLRELKEETGVTSAQILAEVPYWLTYDFPPAVREKLRIIWGSDWKGQAQKWFLLKFTGKDDEINLLGDGSEKPEFGEWLWMTPEQVVELAVEFKKPVYKNILEVFSPFVQGDGGS